MESPGTGRGDTHRLSGEEVSSYSLETPSSRPDDALFVEQRFWSRDAEIGQLWIKMAIECFV